MKVSSLIFQFTFLLAFSAILSNEANAQIWKRIKSEAESRAGSNVVNKVGNATDKTIDKAVDVITRKKASHQPSSDEPGEPSDKISSGTAASYKNYDFVPGDKIIFEPDMSKEADAELPARFVINKGNAEIQSADGEKVLHLQQDAHTSVSPSMNSDHYLPEQFTLEFDMMYENPDGSYFRYASDFDVAFRKRGDRNFGSAGLFNFTIVGTSQVKLGPHGTSVQYLSKESTASLSAPNSWHHIAIYVRKNIGKAYIDASRVYASNTLPVGADFFDIEADRYGIKIKNVRLAAGGADKYNSIVTDGKFITHGILFDVNHSTIKPESTGTLNEIAKMMKDHSDLRFEIDGHTDSDGNADANLKLSQARADAVKSQLVKMGIAENRLTAKGFGATKPIDKNDNAEGKANNRRVEFVKI